MANQSLPTARLQGRIKSVTIRGFRSLGHIENLELPQLTVLIGANGAGKSNLIRFFDMLGWMLRGQNLQEFIQRQGGGDDLLFMGARRTPRMDAEIRIETQKGFNDYRFGLAHVTAGNGLFFVDEAYRYAASAVGSPADWVVLDSHGREAALLEAAATNQTARSIAGLLKRCVSYHFHDTSPNAYIQQPWDIQDAAWLRSDGANLAPILLRLQEEDIRRYRLIEKQIARVLPGFAGFDLQPVQKKVLLRWRSTHSDKTFGPNLTSDGSLRLFCLMTLLNLPPDNLPDVLFFDEPELGLHPHAISLVAEMFKSVASDRQVFIATQSPYMVDCFDLENIIVARTHEGETTLRHLPQDQYRAWLEDEYMLSDIWLKETVGSAI